MHPAPETPPLIFQPAPDSNVPISLNEARYRHIDYLQRGPTVYVKSGEDAPVIQVLHSLLLNQEDLDLLYRNAQGGIRLHLCRESSGNFNIVAVPVGANGELNINPDSQTGRRPIANTLSPCPVICSKDFSETGLNCWDDNGDLTWVDPNSERGGKIWYKKGSEGEKIFVDAPDGAPHATA